LAIMPLHRNENAYQAGKSVETALRQLVVWVEMALDLRERSFGCFLIQKKAFKNIFYNSMCAALFKHAVDYTIIWWVRATLEGHMAAVTLGGSSKSVVVFRGFPQGDVLSPLLWCLVVDLIARLNGGVKGSWPGHTGVIMLPIGDTGGLGRVLAFPRGGRHRF